MHKTFPDLNEVRQQLTRLQMGMDLVPEKNLCNGEELNYRTAIVDDGGKEKKITVPLGYSEAMKNLQKMNHERLGKVNGVLFGKPTLQGEDIRWMIKTHDYFAFIGVLNDCAPDWKSGKGCMTKDEAFSQVIHAADQYRIVELAPHEPPMEGAYYNYPPLPKPSMTALNYVIDQFSPASEIDKALIAAFFITTCWGGPARMRPIFTITSEDGRGVGKSTLAYMAAHLLNQVAIESRTAEKVEDFKRRLLSEEGLRSRIILYDNEAETRTTSASLASMVTSPAISGHRMYAGEGSRPNTFMWIITLNGFNFDSDLASRSIPIHLARPKYNANWENDLREYITDHRWEIVSAILHILKRTKRAGITPSRWGQWEHDVLSRLGGWCTDIPALQRLIHERQGESDEESEEVELIREEFQRQMRADGRDPEEDMCFFSSNTVWEIYVNLTNKRNIAKATASRTLRALIAGGKFPEMEYGRHNNQRGFIWCQDKSFPTMTHVVNYNGEQ